MLVSFHLVSIGGRNYSSYGIRWYQLPRPITEDPSTSWLPSSTRIGWAAFHCCFRCAIKQHIFAFAPSQSKHVRFLRSGVVSTVVQDSPHKIFLGGLPNYLNEDQVTLKIISLPSIHSNFHCIGIWIGCSTMSCFQSNHLCSNILGRPLHRNSFAVWCL